METVAVLTNVLIFAFGSYSVLSAGRNVQLTSNQARKGLSLQIFGLRPASAGN